MKARLLKKLMNDSGYIPSDNPDYIAMGSPMCHDLIKVDKKTLKVTYALDTFREGKKALGNETLNFIWDKFHELIENGQIHDIINGYDEIENPIPVYTVENGKLIESHTDEYGWPNTTYDGKLLYENVYFKTKEEAIEKGIREVESYIKFSNEIIEQLNNDLNNVKEALSINQSYKENLINLKNELQK